jgi:hypothetical protein
MLRGAGEEFKGCDELLWCNKSGQSRERGSMVSGNRADRTVGVVLGTIMVMVGCEQRGEQQQAYYDNRQLFAHGLNVTFCRQGCQAAFKHAGCGGRTASEMWMSCDLEQGKS